MKSCEIYFDDFIFNKQMTVYLMILKIPPKLDGFEFIKSAVKKIENSVSKKYNINNELYPDIANEFNVSKIMIDRSIRHAIKVSYERGGIKDIEKYSGHQFICEKPSPKELLCLLAELVKIEKIKFINDFKHKYGEFCKSYIKNPINKYKKYLKQE